MSCITNERRPTERPLVDRIAVYQGKFGDGGGALEQSGHVKLWKAPLFERFQDSLTRYSPVPVLAIRCVVGNSQLANPISQQPARLGSWPDRIGNDPLMKMSRNDHGMAVEKRLGIDSRAPQ